MKIMIPQFVARLAVLSLFIATIASAAGIPEPRLVMYGAVRNTAAGNARLITGTLIIPKFKFPYSDLKTEPRHLGSYPERIFWRMNDFHLELSYSPTVLSA